MVLELKSKIAVIGAGPAGCICAYYLQDCYEVTLFDFGEPLRTLLPTGGGRCNLAYAEYDFRELVKFYPRGEKFLYSVFSQFSTADALAFFDEIGVSTYMQDDYRIFPCSNSARAVREKFLCALKNIRFIKEKVVNIERVNYLFKVVTNLQSYNFDKIVIATGGHASYNIIRNLGHKIIEPRPALVGLVCDKNFAAISGVTLQNVRAVFLGQELCGDILFTHKGVSGPLIYKISSIVARESMPYKISFDFLDEEIDLQKILNENSQKSIKNIISDFVPKSLASYILNTIGINEYEKAHRINGTMRDSIMDYLKHFEVNVIDTVADGEVVTAGGVDLDEINPKTMESKLEPGIYFCGEVLNIDGFCGGFNLQNCWSTGYVAAKGVMQH